MNQSIRTQKRIADNFAKLRQEFTPNRLVASLTAGVIVGLLEILLAISFAALIFAGPLSTFVANGIGLILLASIITITTISLFTSLPGVVGGSQDIPPAILAVIAASIANTLSATNDEQEVFLTVVATIGITALVTGIFLWGLGQFKLSGLVRFLPYPVVGGFLAGTGWLLASGAISTMADSKLNTTLFQPELLVRWLPGLFFAIALFFILNRIKHSLVIPGMVAGGILLFYLITMLAGNSPAALTAQGWLLGPFPSGGLWQPFSLTDLNRVQWSIIGGQAVNIATIVIMSAIALLLNATGLEIATRHDMNLNHELKTAGIANFAAGLMGGLVGYHQLSISAMNHKLGANGRLPGLLAAVLCLIALLFGASALSFFPKVVLGGLLLYLGFSFLVEWVYDAWFKLPRLDYFVVILILLVTAFVGFLEAVGVGLITAVILFVINYSRIDIIRHELSGATQHSRVTRPPRQQEILNKHGEQRYILQLQGFIFFGTADNLLKTIRARLDNPHLPPPQYIILDFRRVTAIDSTASLSFNRLKQLSEAQEITLVLAAMSSNMQQQLQKSGFGPGAYIHIAPDLDRGLEWCEQQLLQQLDPNPAIPEKLWQQLQALLTESSKIEELMTYLERQEVPIGHHLIHQGDSPDALYFIESGQVTAQLERPDQQPIRLQTMRGGHIVGEIGFYLEQQRTAAVIADEPSVIYRLSLDTLEQMETKDPEIASTLHQLIIHRLAERVNHLVQALNALQR